MITGPVPVMASERVAEFVWASWLESVTLKVRDVPFAAAVGVPLITPLAERLSPAGSVPAVSVQV